MTETVNGTFQNLFGIYEIDSGGTVLYHRSAFTEQTNGRIADLTGRNFFDELTFFQNSRDFEHRYKVFIKNTFPADDFKFNFQTPEKVLESKVKLVRIAERQNNETSNLVIIDIRRV